MEKRLNIIVDDVMHKELRIALAEDGVNFSDLCRSWIEDYLKEHKRKSWKHSARPKRKEGA